MINYSSMSKQSSTSKTGNTFSLTRFKKTCYYAPIRVDFAPISRAGQTSRPIMPQFNHDRQFFTPAFLIPYDQSSAQTLSPSFLDHERQKFLQKLPAPSSSPANQPVLFNPRGDLYCSICSLAFDCYWEHINSKSHIRRIKSSAANAYINELCLSHQRNRINSSADQSAMPRPCLKKKKITKDAKRAQRVATQETFKTEDFIIRFPKELLEREELNNCNMSTNGVNSINLKP